MWWTRTSKLSIKNSLSRADRLALREREGRRGVDFDELDEQRSDVGRVDAEPRDPPVVA